MRDFRKRLIRLEEIFKDPADSFEEFRMFYEQTDSLSKALFEFEARYCLNEHTRSYMIRMGVLPEDAPRLDIHDVAAGLDRQRDEGKD